jgi:hypothetical protein
LDMPTSFLSIVLIPNAVALKNTQQDKKIELT